MGLGVHFPLIHPAQIKTPVEGGIGWGSRCGFDTGNSVALVQQFDLKARKGLPKPQVFRTLKPDLWGAGSMTEEAYNELLRGDSGFVAQLHDEVA